MEILTTIEFWSIVGNVGLGIALFISGAKTKGSLLVIETIKEAIKEYANEPDKPNQDVVKKVNSKLSEKNQIKD